MGRLKLSLLLFFLLFWLNQGTCQTAIGISYGVFKPEVNITDYQDVPEPDRSKFTGQQSFRLGLTSYFKLTNFLTLRPELYFFNTAFKEQLDTSYFQFQNPPGWDDKYKIQSTHRLQQIRLPVLLNFSFHLLTLKKTEDKTKKPLTMAMDIFAGPYASLTISHRRNSIIEHTRSSSNDPSDTYNFTRNEGEKENLPLETINRWDYGAILGIGLKASVSQNIRVFIDARNSFSSYNLNNGLWDRVTRKPNNPLETYTVSPKVTLKYSLLVSAGIILNINFKK